VLKEVSETLSVGRVIEGADIDSYRAVSYLAALRFLVVVLDKQTLHAVVKSEVVIAIEIGG
jgi:hypothetical protein